MNWCNIDLGWAYGDLLRSVHRETQNLDQAYDVLHDALVRLALTKDRERIHQPHAYLRTVVRSVLTDHARDGSRWLPFADFDGRETYDPALAPSPEHLAEIRERLHQLRRLVDALPKRCRQIFWLFRVEGYTLAEIADRLEISVRAVQYHVSRAMMVIVAAAEA